MDDGDDFRRNSLRIVDNEVRIASQRSKSKRRRKQMRPQDPNTRVITDQFRTRFNRIDEAFGGHWIVVGNPCRGLEEFAPCLR